MHKLWSIFKSASNGFIDDKVMKLSGALSFYMIFSMGPLLLIIITICSIFFGHAAVEGKVYAQLQGFIGHDTAIQLQSIIQHAAISGKNSLATVIGVIFLLIGASSVFAEMQDSINIIWGLKPKPKSGWIAFLKNRLLSFSIIISLGFLLLVSLSISALVEEFGNHLRLIVPDISVMLVYAINLCITIGITTFIFAVIFKVLPDAEIKWKDVTVGAITTMILFLIGKFAISFYISKTNVGTTYGASGSLIVLLLWIYYSAMIVYFGAEFTKYYAVVFGDQIKPADYAVTVRQVEEEKGKMSIQEREKIKKNKGSQMKYVASILFIFLFIYNGYSQVKDTGLSKGRDVTDLKTELSLIKINPNRYSLSYQNAMNSKEDARSIVFKNKKEIKSFLSIIGLALKSKDGVTNIVVYPSYKIRLLTETGGVFMIVDEAGKTQATFRIARENYEEICREITPQT